MVDEVPKVTSERLTASQGSEASEFDAIVLDATDEPLLVPRQGALVDAPTVRL